MVYSDIEFTKEQIQQLQKGASAPNATAEDLFWLGYYHNNRAIELDLNVAAFAYDFYDESDKEEAIALFTRAANANHGKALFYLGDRLKFGTPEERAKAASLFQQAVQALHAEAEKDHWRDAEARYVLGDCYEEGLGGVVKNKHAAAKWWKQAAVQGHHAAQRKLGDYYSQEQKSCDQAARWYAQLDTEHGQHSFLKSLFEKDKNLAQKLATRGPDDYLSAAALTVCYQTGVGVPSDPVQARRWQQTANGLQSIPSSWLPSCLVPAAKEPQQPQQASSTSNGLHKYFNNLTFLSPPAEPSTSSSRRYSNISLEPFDVFLVHTGAQKREIVAPMKDHFQQVGLRCFLDMEMTPADGSPTECMRYALETCRHAVVVVSREFLERDAGDPPCEELAFAFRRMEWLRETNNHSSQKKSWESLWIVLFHVGVEDYKQACKRNRQLPKLTRHLVVKEYPGFRYEAWTVLYKELAEDLKRHDSQGDAVARWQYFLKHRWQVEAHPKADDLYDGTT